MSARIPVTTVFRAETGQAVDAIDRTAAAIDEFGADATTAGREASAALDRAGAVIVDALAEVERAAVESAAQMGTTAESYQADARQIGGSMDSIVAEIRQVVSAVNVLGDRMREGTRRVTDGAEDQGVALRELGSEAAAAARKFVGTGVAILGFASVVEGSRKAIEIARRTLSEYIADTEELQPVAAATSGAVDAFRSAVLGQIVTVENASVVAGTLQGVLGGLSDALRVGEGTARGLADAVARGLVSAVIAGADVVQFFSSIVTAAKLAADVYRVALLAQQAAVVDLALAFRTGLTAALSEFLELLGTGARVAGDVLSRVIGEDSVAALRRLEAGFTGSAEATRSQVEDLRLLRDEMRGVAAREAADLRASMAQTVDGAIAFAARVENLKTEMRDLRNQIDAGTVSLTAYTAQTQAASIASQALADDIDKIKAARIAAAEADRLAAETAAANEFDVLAKARAEAEARYQISQELAAAQAELERQAREEALATSEARINAAAETAGAILASQDSVRDALRREVGEALRAKAQEFAALAAANAVALRPFRAAAYAAGAGVLYGAAAAMGAGGGAGSSAGGGVPAAAAPTVTNITNRSITVSATGVVTDQVVRQIAEAVTLAEDGGMLRRPA